MTERAPGHPGKMLVAAVIWLGLALAIGASGALDSARPPIPQGLIVGLTTAVLILFRKWQAFRHWALTVDIRALVGIHVSRFFVAIYFLVLYGRGELPYAFAVPGAWGDMAVAATALAACVFAPPRAGRRRGIIFAWNVFGLVDILMVVATAARVGMADPESMRALLRLPLSLLPTFLVPIIIATHFIILRRLWSPAR